MSEEGRNKKLEEVIDKFILAVDSLGFDIEGDKIGESIELIITRKKE